MRNRRSIQLAAVLAGSAALGVMFLSSCEFGPRMDRALHAEIGKALAKEAVRLLGPGRQIKLITRDSEAFPQPALDVLRDSFKREVHRAGATIVATQTIQTDPLRPVGLPSGDFFELLRRSTPEQVIVSLLGPPLLTEEQRHKLGGVKPKIVAFWSGDPVEDTALRSLFDAGLLHAAVVSRRLASATGTQPQNTFRTFDRLYRTVNGASLAGLPSLSAEAPSSGDR